jgi:hypothetical protein
MRSLAKNRPFIIACILVILSVTTCYIYRAACTYNTTVRLSDRVKVTTRSYTDGYGGPFATRSVDIYRDGKHWQRVWCGPLPGPTSLSQIFVALCRGQSSEYLSLRDDNRFWIVNLSQPEEVRTTFPEKSPPVIETEYCVADKGYVKKWTSSFSDWERYVKREQKLLEEP